MTIGLYGCGLERRESSADWETRGGPTTADQGSSVDARPTRARHEIVTAAAGAAGHRSPAGRRRRRIAALGAFVVAGVVASCSTGSEAGPDPTSPTFARANGASLALEEPLASVADLVAPAEEGEPWTIVGSIFNPSTSAAEATVWTAEDGRDWQATTVDPHDRGTGETMVAATRTPDGMVAVGQIGNGAEGDAAVWHLDDGEWKLSLPESLGGDHEQWAFEVVSGESGILVAGGEIVWGELRPRLWFSPDGETWTSVDGGAGGPLDGTGEESVRDIAAVGAGFVAVGTRTVDNEQDGLAWWSDDGETWEALDTPTLGGPRRQDVLTVAHTDAGIVAGGYSSDDSGLGQPVVWTSADGRTWGPGAAVPLRDERRSSASSDLAVRSITVAPEGLVAAGGDEWRPYVWTSTDGGVTWKDTGDPVHGGLFEDGVNLRDAEQFGDTVLAVGSEPSVLMLRGASPRWQNATNDAFPAGGEQPFATSVAAGPDTAIAVGGRRTAPAGEQREVFRGQVWQSAGDGWEAVDSDHLSAGQVMDVTAFEGGFVAVGYEDRGLANKRKDLAVDPEPDGLVWVSPNGAEWARIGTKDARIDDANLQYLEDPSPENAAVLAQMEAETPPESAPPAGGAGTRALAAVTPINEGFLAVGSMYHDRDADPVIIASGDGLGFIGEEPPHTGSGIQRYHDVCVGPDGTAIAVGVSGTPRAFDVIVAARNAETGVWSAAEGPFTGDGDQQGYGCAASEDGFIAVGADDSSGNVDARVWTSEDGLTWTELDSSLLGGTGDQWASTVVAVPDGGWLVGGSDTSAGDGDIALWRIDEDGDLERRDRDEPALSGPGDQSVSSISIDDGRVTLTGNDYGRVGLWESDKLDR